MAEAQIGFDRSSPSSGPSQLDLVGALQLAFVYPPPPGELSAFLGPSIAFQRLDPPGNTEWGYGVALGIRYLPLPFLALRLEGRYRTWSNLETDEIGVALAFGVVF